MSEIIYKGPTATGTTINPTDQRIPVRSNATTFIDSCLFNDSTRLISLFSSLNNGIYLDSANRRYKFGQISDATTNRTQIDINDAFNYITILNNGSTNGFTLDFGNNTYTFGDFSGASTTYLFVNGNAQTIESYQNGNSKGFRLDLSTDQSYLGNYSFGNRLNFEVNNSANIIRINKAGVTTGLQMLFNTRNFQFGDFTTQNTRLVINDTGRELYTTCNSNTNGIYFSLGTGARTYQFGQITGSNRNQLFIDDVNQTIYTLRNGSKTGISIDTNLVTIGSLTLGNQLGLGTNDSSQAFIFNGTGITTPTATGTAGHLKVIVNGTPYRIQLLNP